MCRKVRPQQERPKLNSKKSRLATGRGVGLSIRLLENVSVGLRAARSMCLPGDWDRAVPPLHKSSPRAELKEYVLVVSPAYKTVRVFLFKTTIRPCGPPGWLRWLNVQLLAPAQVMIIRFMSSSPCVGLCVGSVVCWDSLSLSAPPLHTLSLSRSQNKYNFKSSDVAETLNSFIPFLHRLFTVKQLFLTPRAAGPVAAGSRRWCGTSSTRRGCSPQWSSLWTGWPWATWMSF